MGTTNSRGVPYLKINTINSHPNFLQSDNHPQFSQFLQIKPIDVRYYVSLLVTILRLNIKYI